MLVISVSEVL